MSTVNNNTTLHTFVTITSVEAKNGCVRVIKLPDMIYPVQIKIPVKIKNGAAIKLDGILCNGENGAIVKKTLFVAVNVMEDRYSESWKYAYADNAANGAGNNAADAGNPTKTKKKSKKRIWIPIAAIAALIVVSFSCMIGTLSEENAATKAQTANASYTDNSKSSSTTNNITSNNTSNTDNSSNDTFYASYELAGYLYEFDDEDEYNEFLEWVDRINSIDTSTNIEPESTSDSTYDNESDSITSDSESDTFYAEYNLGGDLYIFHNETEYQQFLTWLEEVNNVDVDVNVSNTAGTEIAVSDSKFMDILTSCRWVSTGNGEDFLLWLEFYSDNTVIYSDSIQHSFTDNFSLKGNCFRFVHGNDSYTISLTENTLTLTSAAEGSSQTFYSLNVLPSVAPSDCPESVAIEILDVYNKNPEKYTLVSCEYNGMYEGDYGQYFAKFTLSNSEFLSTTSSGKKCYKVRNYEITCIYIPTTNTWNYWNLQTKGSHKEFSE